MSEHTKGKLIAQTYDDGSFELAIDGAGYAGGALVIASRNKHTGRPMEMKANARRLVACWNYCDGLDTDGMETAAKIDRPIKRYIDEAYAKELDLLAQRDELLAALKDCTTEEGPDQDALNRAREAIAKAEAK